MLYIHTTHQLCQLLGNTSPYHVASHSLPQKQVMLSLNYIHCVCIPAWQDVSGIDTWAVSLSWEELLKLCNMTLESFHRLLVQLLSLLSSTTSLPFGCTALTHMLSLADGSKTTNILSYIKFRDILMVYV